MLVVMFSVAAIFAQDASKSMYGVSPDGMIYIHKSYIDKTEGKKPMVKCSPNWANKAMTLKGDYYVYETGRKIIMPLTWCVAIGSERYIPHALDGVDVVGLDPADIKDNGKGGFNFMTAPSPFPVTVAAAPAAPAADVKKK